MKGLKALGVWFAIAGVLFSVPVAAVALILAVGHDGRIATHTTAMPHMSNGAMANMGAAMGSGGQTQTGAANAELTILHVQRGCHVWSDGKVQTPTLELNMQPGQMLQVLNQDVDMHRMVEMSGPAMMLGGPMKTGQSESLTFAKPGTYTFHTKSSEMMGMAEVSTTGPDNNLKLTVVVA
jgi:plastocyanin